MRAGPRSAQEREVEMASDSSRNCDVDRQLAGALARRYGESPRFMQPVTMLPGV